MYNFYLDQKIIKYIIFRNNILLEKIKNKNYFKKIKENLNFHLNSRTKKFILSLFLKIIKIYKLNYLIFFN